MFKRISTTFTRHTTPSTLLPIRFFTHSLRTMATKNSDDHKQKAQDPTGHEQRFDQEKTVKRNPHPDFRKVEASRPDWEEKNTWHFTKTKLPGWKLGQGANDGGESLKKKHVEIDPYEESRPAVFNYKLLISGIIPRPIGFVSTRSEDGKTQLPTPHLKSHLLIQFYRQIYKPRPLLLHPSNKPRPPPLHNWLRRRLLQRQRHAAQPRRNKRMHHQHNQRALPRSRQRRLNKRTLRNLRMVSLRPDTRSLYGCES